MEDPKNIPAMEQPSKGQLYVLSKEKVKKLGDISFERILSQLSSKYKEQQKSEFINKIRDTQVNKRTKSLEQYFSKFCMKFEELPKQVLDMVKEYKGDSIPFLLSILHINFSKLQTLSLIYCGLHNIEALTVLNASSLLKLDLSKNYLTDVNPLAKTHFPQLSRLVIQGNFINKAQKLIRLNLEKLKRVRVNDCWFTKSNLMDGVRFLLILDYEGNQKQIYLQSWQNGFDLRRPILTKLERTRNKIREYGNHFSIQ